MGKGTEFGGPIKKQASATDRQRNNSTVPPLTLGGGDTINGRKSPDFIKNGLP